MSAYATKYYPLTRCFVQSNHPIQRAVMKTEYSTPQSFATTNYVIARSFLTSNHPRAEDLVCTDYSTPRSLLKSPYTMSRNIIKNNSPARSYYPLSSSKLTSEDYPSDYLTTKRATPDPPFSYSSLTNDFLVTRRPVSRGGRSNVEDGKDVVKENPRLTTPDYPSLRNDYQSTRTPLNDYQSTRSALRGATNDYKSARSILNNYTPKSRTTTPEKTSYRSATKENTPILDETSECEDTSDYGSSAYKASRSAVSDYLATRRALNGLPPPARINDYKSSRSAQQEYDTSKRALKAFQASRDATKEQSLSRNSTPNYKRATPDHRITTPEYHVSKGPRNEHQTSRSAAADHTSTGLHNCSTPEQKIVETPEEKLIKNLKNNHHISRLVISDHSSPTNPRTIIIPENKSTKNEIPKPTKKNHLPKGAPREHHSSRGALVERPAPQEAVPRSQGGDPSKGSASREMPVHWPGRSSSCTARELKKILTEPSGGSFVIPFDACNEVYPGVFIGDMHTALCTQELVAMGVTHVLNAAQKDPRPGQQAPGYYVNTSPGYYSRVHIKYLGVPATDVISFDLSPYFEDSANFIDKALAKKGKVLVHCHQGISRSATLVLAFLMLRRGMSAQEAMRTVRAKREIIPNPSFLRQLCELNDKLTSGRRRFQDMARHI